MSITYFDTSALVKKYVNELGTQQTREFFADMEMAGTAMITQAEMASALSRASRMGKIEENEAKNAWEVFLVDWESLYLIEITKPLMSRAGTLAWEEKLRGYDAVHLAAVLAWRETLDLDITLATFDEELWNAAKRLEFAVFPKDLPGILELRQPSS